VKVFHRKADAEDVDFLGGPSIVSELTFGGF
jgi:hypothetical protein